MTASVIKQKHLDIFYKQNLFTHKELCQLSPKNCPVFTLLTIYLVLSDVLEYLPDNPDPRILTFVCQFTFHFPMHNPLLLTECQIF